MSKGLVLVSLLCLTLVLAGCVEQSPSTNNTENPSIGAGANQSPVLNGSLIVQSTTTLFPLNTTSSVIQSTTTLTLPSSSATSSVIGNSSGVGPGTGVQGQSVYTPDFNPTYCPLDIGSSSIANFTQSDCSTLGQLSGAFTSFQNGYCFFCPGRECYESFL